MSAISVAIQEKVERLSPLRQNELMDFAEFLLSKESPTTTPAARRELAFDWVIDSEDEPLPDSAVVNKLMQEVNAPHSRGLTFDWCADPDDQPAEMTSVEMQHEVLEWMALKAEEDFTSHETIA